MEIKPKSIKLVDFKEELLPSGRKLMHCVFEDKYGGSRFRYRWTAPWGDKESEHGVERLFLKCHEIEEWNEPNGVWSEELSKVSKEVPSLDEISLPVKIEMGDVSEDTKEDQQGKSQDYWVISVRILDDELPVRHYKKFGNDYIAIGSVNMAWELLKKELFATRWIALLSKEMEDIDDWVDATQDWESIGIRFHVWVEKAIDRIEYQVASREIVSCIRRFIRTRLSEHKAMKRGFEEDDSGDEIPDLEDIPFE